jgi:hypothetical protein
MGAEKRGFSCGPVWSGSWPWVGGLTTIASGPSRRMRARRSKLRALVSVRVLAFDEEVVARDCAAGPLRGGAIDACSTYGFSSVFAMAVGGRDTSADSAIAARCIAPVDAVTLNGPRRDGARSSDLRQPGCRSIHATTSSTMSAAPMRERRYFGLGTTATSPSEGVWPAGEYVTLRQRPALLNAPLSHPSASAWNTTGRRSPVSSMIAFGLVPGCSVT